IEQSRLGNDDRAFDITGGFHQWTEGPMLRQRRKIDVLERKNNVADLDRITTVAHDASERELRLGKDDIHLRNFKVVHTEHLVGFCTSCGVRYRPRGPDDFIAGSRCNSALGAATKIDVLGVRCENAEIVIELSDHL